LQELDTHPIILGPQGVRLPVELTNLQAEHSANTTFPSCLLENIIKEKLGFTMMNELMDPINTIHS